MRIAVLGEALIDFKNTEALNFAGFIGGSSLNVATAAQRLGQATGFLAQISNDVFGQALVGHLQHEGIDRRFVLRSSALSTLAFVSEHGGNAHFSFYGTNAADSTYDPKPRPVLPQSTKMLQFGSISLLTNPTAASIMEIVSQHKDRMVTVYDPNCRPVLVRDAQAFKMQVDVWLGLAALVKVSDQDLAWLEPQRTHAEVAARWLQHGPKAVIVTCGGDGATLYRPGHAPVVVEAPKITVADTVGAGDTFTAALMVALLERGVEDRAALAALTDEGWSQVMDFAAKAAAFNCTRPGANPPTRLELDAWRP